MSDPTAPLADAVDSKVLLGVLAQVKAGDFTARMPLDCTGVAGKVADGFNDVIIANQALTTELARVSRVVGRQGQLSQRVVLGGPTLSWRESVESVNSLIDALVRPTSEMQRVIGAVADGDLSKKITADVRGEMLDLKNTINAMVDQLNGFASEVTRVAREVGTEGRLGQAAAVTIEVGGVWKDLTDNATMPCEGLYDEEIQVVVALVSSRVMPAPLSSSSSSKEARPRSDEESTRNAPSLRVYKRETSTGDSCRRRPASALLQRTKNDEGEKSSRSRVSPIPLPPTHAVADASKWSGRITMRYDELGVGRLKGTLVSLSSQDPRPHSNLLVSVPREKLAARIFAERVCSGEDEKGTASQL